MQPACSTGRPRGRRTHARLRHGVDGGAGAVAAKTRPSGNETRSSVDDWLRREASYAARFPSSRSTWTSPGRPSRPAGLGRKWRGLWAASHATEPGWDDPRQDVELAAAPLLRLLVCYRTLACSGLPFAFACVRFAVGAPVRQASQRRLQNYRRIAALRETTRRCNHKRASRHFSCCCT